MYRKGEVYDGGVLRRVECRLATTEQELREIHNIGDHASCHFPHISCRLCRSSNPAAKEHDLAASLLSKPDPNNYAATGHFPNGDYQVHRYYTLNMTGQRIGTIISSDDTMDAYATFGSGKSKILMGVRPPATGAYIAVLNSLSSLGLPASGSLTVRTLKFTVGSDERYSEIDGPTDLGTYVHSPTLFYNQPDQTTTCA